MGYDDNTPLSRVTGSGLPADIWRETMTRVHQGLPQRGLPMSSPAPQSDFGDQDNGLPISLENTGNGNAGSGNLIDQILTDIFGGNSGSGERPKEQTFEDR